MDFGIKSDPICVSDTFKTLENRYTLSMFPIEPYVKIGQKSLRDIISSGNNMITLRDTICLRDIEGGGGLIFLTFLFASRGIFLRTKKNPLFHGFS